MVCLRNISVDTFHTGDTEDDDDDDDDNNNNNNNNNNNIIRNLINYIDLFDVLTLEFVCVCVCVWCAG